MLDSFVSIPLKQECMKQAGTWSRVQKCCKCCTFDVSNGQTILHAAKKDNRSSSLPSDSVCKEIFQPKWLLPNTTESPVPPGCGSTCLVVVMTPQQRVSDALGDREIQQYHHRNSLVYWDNSSVRSQCEGQLARSLWGIARVMIETRVPQDKGWL